MADVYSSIGGNSRKLPATPLSQFGTPALLALSITSATVNLTTTPTITNSNLSKVVRGLQSHAEIYYVGSPTASGSNTVVALVNANTVSRGGRGASAYGGTDDTGETTYENLEEMIADSLGVAVDDITVAAVALTGLTFA